MFPAVLVLPFPPIVSIIALILALFNISILAYAGEKKAKKNLLNPLLLIGILVFLLDGITGILRDFSFEPFVRESRLSFLVIPLIFSNAYKTLKRLRLAIMTSFVIGLVGYILFSYGYLIYFYNYLTNRSFAINHYLKYDLTTNLPNAYHHTYLGLYLSFAILILLYYAYYDKKISVKIALPLAFFLFVNQIFMGSKITIVMSVLLFVFVLGHHHIIGTRKAILKGGILLMALTALAIFFTSSLKKQGLLSTMDNSINFRVEAWQCATRLIGENAVLGWGRKNGANALDNCVATEMKGTHNQYLEEFLYYGIFGLWILFFFVIIWRKSSSDSLFRGLVAILFILTFSENIFSLQRGIIFIAFFTSLFYFGHFDPSER